MRHGDSSRRVAWYGVEYIVEVAEVVLTELKERWRYADERARAMECTIVFCLWLRALGCGNVAVIIVAFEFQVVLELWTRWLLFRSQRMFQNEVSGQMLELSVTHPKDARVGTSLDERRSMSPESIQRLKCWHMCAEFLPIGRFSR